MEVKVNAVQYKDFNLSCIINSEEIIGMTGENTIELQKILSLQSLVTEDIIINNEKITEKNKNGFRKKISYISKYLTPPNFMKTVHDLMNMKMKKENILVRDSEKKMSDSLKIVGLTPLYLEREIRELSSSEQKLVQIAISLLANPELLLLEEPFLDLDMKNEKKLYMLLLKLKEQYHKAIVITTKDCEILYKYTTKMFFIKNKEVWLTGPTKEVYQRVDYLTKNKFEVPEIVQFTYKAKKEKQVRLDYHIDIRDIIKDIYKHV